MITSINNNKTNFVYLLCALVLFLFAGTLAEQIESSYTRYLDQFASILMLSIAVTSYRQARHKFLTAVLLTIGVVIVVVISQPFPSTAADFIHLGLLLVFFLWATWMSVRQVLFSGTVDGNMIVGSICIYLLLGLIWTILYMFIAQGIPGAFAGVEQASWDNNFSSLTYYSYVTLTTLGYGDITPSIPIAQFLSYMEAVTGVLYVAILVASLVGAKVSIKSS